MKMIKQFILATSIIIVSGSIHANQTIVAKKSLTKVDQQVINEGLRLTKIIVNNFSVATMIAQEFDITGQPSKISEDELIYKVIRTGVASENHLKADVILSMISWEILGVGKNGKTAITVYNNLEKQLIAKPHHYLKEYRQRLNKAQIKTEL